MKKKVFNESEVSSLLERAARMQAASEHSSTSGLTLDEIHEAARAAGIDPHWVDVAARTPEEEPARKMLGLIPVGVERSRVAGGEFSDEAWSTYVSWLRRTLGGAGTSEAAGPVKEWRRAPLRISAEETDGKTLLHARADWSQEAGGMMAGAATITAMGLMIAIAGIAKGKLAALAVAAMPFLFGLVAMIYVVARFRAKEVRVGDKFDRALEQAARSVEPAAQSIASAERAGESSGAAGTEDPVHAQELSGGLLDDSDGIESEGAPRRNGRARRRTP